MARLNLAGQKIGRLFVKEFIEMKDGNSVWLCECECGSELPVFGWLLHRKQRGLSKVTVASCGCLRRGRKKTHGMTYTPEWRAWSNMKSRCYCKSSREYPQYGGRGITVCDKWRNDFEAFFADIGLRPTSDHSLDREEVNGNYEPGNCRWATKQEQTDNRRPIKVITNFTNEELFREIGRRGLEFRDALVGG
jgi:hypothetical protein